MSLSFRFRSQDVHSFCSVGIGEMLYEGSFNTLYESIYIIRASKVRVINHLHVRLCSMPRSYLLKE